jgi:hypothetical protein
MAGREVQDDGELVVQALVARVRKEKVVGMEIARYSNILAPRRVGTALDSSKFNVWRHCGQSES